MDKYSEYLLGQINDYREMMEEDPGENHMVHKTVLDELLHALAEYQNFKAKPYIS